MNILSKRVLQEAYQFHHPEMEMDGHSVKNLELKVGNLQVHLTSGVAAYLVVAGKPRGLYFKGEGSYAYLATDPLQFPLTKYNLSQNTDLTPVSVGGALKVGEPITEAVIWLDGMDLPALGTGTQALVPKEAYEATRAFFSTRETALPPMVMNLANLMPLGQLMAYRDANAPSTKVASIEMTGSKEHWVYTFDGARSRMESLWIQGPVDPSGSGEVPGILVSLQPIGWSRKAPLDPDFRLAHLDVNLVASKKTWAKLDVVETIQVIRPGLRDFSFKLTDLHPSTSGALRRSAVQSVTDSDGGALDFDERAGYLLVQTRSPQSNGNIIKLHFAIEGDLLGGDQSSFTLWRLGPGEGWYPEPDQAAQGFTVTSKIAVDKPFVPIASAKTIKRYSTDTQNVLESSLDKPTTWFSVTAGNYECKELVEDGLTVRAWGYSGIGHGADPLLRTTHGILKFYKMLFGDVPFDEINLVEYPSLGFGQAPAGMIWLTREAFDAIGDDTNRMVASQGAVGGWVNRMIAHELAHQYWGHQVKMFGNEDQWLTEAFAEYTSSLAIKAMKRKGPDVYNAIIRDWADQAKEPSKTCTIPFANYLSPTKPSDFGNRQKLIYDKGAYLLACLNHEMGDQKFITFLRAYQKNFAWYPPSYNEDVPNLLKAVTGKDHHKWFDDYFWGTGMPDWKP